MQALPFPGFLEYGHRSKADPAAMPANRRLSPVAGVRGET